MTKESQRMIYLGTEKDSLEAIVAISRAELRRNVMKDAAEAVEKKYGHLPRAQRRRLAQETGKKWYRDITAGRMPIK